jgi:hypothetical protein
MKGTATRAGAVWDASTDLEPCRRELTPLPGGVQTAEEGNAFIDRRFGGRVSQHSNTLAAGLLQGHLKTVSRATTAEHKPQLLQMCSLR